jgi:hypothetical protein
MKRILHGDGVDHCANFTRPEPRPFAARLSCGSLADFLARKDLADFLLDLCWILSLLVLRILRGILIVS